MRVHFHENEEIDLQCIANNEDTRSVLFQIIQYNDLECIERDLTTFSDLQTFLESSSFTANDYCTWINIEGIHRNDILEKISIQFNLHQLIMEDIKTMSERMKLDVLDHGAAIYLLMKMIYIHPNLNRICLEQMSFVLKENDLLLTFQNLQDTKNSYDIFQVVKYRLKNNRGRIRSMKIDYLFYCLLDVLIENYMMTLEQISIKIDKVDKLLINELKDKGHMQISRNHFNADTLKVIFRIRHDILRLRILCQPLREIMIKLQKTQDRISMTNQSVQSRRQYRRKKRPKRVTLEGNYFFNPHADLVEEKKPLFNEYIFIYFKDLNDHIIQLQDRIDTYVDVLASLTSFYIILTDAKMNQIMTFLSLVSVTFIPLTCFIGIFSMNFDNMPPLVWDHAYFVTLGVMGVYVIAMILFFKFKEYI